MWVIIICNEGAVERQENVQGVQGLQVQSKNLHPLQGKPSPQTAPTLQYLQNHAITTHLQPTANSAAAGLAVSAKVEDLRRAGRAASVIEY